jgi:hypothetical protein
MAKYVSDQESRDQIAEHLAMKDYVDELRMFTIQALITEARPLHCRLSWTCKAALLRFTRPR